MIRIADAAALVPGNWRERVTRLCVVGGPTGAEWVDRLPRVLAEVLDEWGLRPSGPTLTGSTAIVLPVERDGARLMLKLGWPRDDRAGEPLALRLWDGDGAVRLVAANPARSALLLERLNPTRDLTDPMIDTDTACEVVGGLLARLHLAAPPNLRSVADFTSDHLHGPHGVAAAQDHLPRRAIDRAVGLAAELLARPDAETTVVHGDLHFAHVLGADREPWLVIGPKPLAGHPGVDVAPALRSRTEELGTGSALRWSVRHRLEVVCAEAGIDEDLARYWTLVMSTIEANRAARGDATGDVGFHLAVAKALDD